MKKNLSFKNLYKNPSFDKNESFVPNVPMYLVDTHLPSIKVLPKGATLKKITSGRLSRLEKGGKKKSYKYYIEIDKDPLFTEFFFPEEESDFKDAAQIESETVVGHTVVIPFRQEISEYILFINKNDAKKCIEKLMKKNLTEFKYNLLENYFKFMSDK